MDRQVAGDVPVPAAKASAGLCLTVGLSLTGLASDGEDDEGVLVRQWCCPPDSSAHQEDSVPAKRAGRCEDLNCSSAYTKNLGSEDACSHRASDVEAYLLFLPNPLARALACKRDRAWETCALPLGLRQTLFIFTS